MLKQNLLINRTTALLTFCALPSAIGWAQVINCSNDQQRYRHLNKPLFYKGQKGDQSDRLRYDKAKKSGTAALTGFVRELVIRELNRGVSASEIASYLSCTQQNDVAEPTASFSLREWDPRATNSPVSFGRDVEGGPLNVTALVLNRGANVVPDTMPIVQCFAKQGSHWVLVGQAGEDYERHTFDVYHLRSPVPTETWFLLAGKIFGGSGGDLKLELVTCDHNGVAVKWRRGNLYGGKVSVENDGQTVMLSYEKPGPDGIVPAIHGNVETATEILSVTPDGLR
jgi:hypothetical protein